MSYTRVLLVVLNGEVLIDSVGPDNEFRRQISFLLSRTILELNLCGEHNVREGIFDSSPAL